MEQKENCAHIFQVKQGIHACTSLRAHVPDPLLCLHSVLQNEVHAAPWCTLSSNVMCSKHFHVTHGILHIGHYYLIHKNKKANFLVIFPKRLVS